MVGIGGCGRWKWTRGLRFRPFRVSSLLLLASLQKSAFPCILTAKWQQRLSKFLSRRTTSTCRVYSHATSLYHFMHVVSVTDASAFAPFCAAIIISSSSRTRTASTVLAGGSVAASGNFPVSHVLTGNLPAIYHTIYFLVISKYLGGDTGAQPYN